MGEIINKKAAANDIAQDCRDTLTAATARGGQAASLATQYLQAALQVFDMLDKRLQAAEQQLGPLVAELDAVDDRTDAMLGRLADDIWNDIGRPAADPIYSLLFPEGVGFYTDGPDAEQPARMELLAELLLANLHPKLDAKQAKDRAKQVRDAAVALRAAVDKTVGPRTQVTTLGRARTAVARSLQLSLVNLKRHYRAQGLSERDIHAMIPDRGKPKTKTPAAPAPAPLIGSTPAPTPN